MNLTHLVWFVSWKVRRLGKAQVRVHLLTTSRGYPDSTSHLLGFIVDFYVYFYYFWLKDLMNKLISANFLKFIGVTFSSWECQYFCRVPILYNPKTFRRVPSNTSTRPRMNATLSLVTFPAKIREFGESRSFTWTFLFYHWFQFLLACENIRFSSLFAAGDVSRGGETSPSTKSEEKRMF